MPSETPSYSIAVATVPYAVPFAVGIVLLVWGVLELDPLITTYYGDVSDLFETLVVVTFGSVLFLFGIAGTLSVTIRESTPQ